VTRYFCRKYLRWMTKDTIVHELGGKCFSMQKGRRKGRHCSSLVILD